MKCSHIACREEGIVTATITEQDIIDVKKKWLESRTIKNKHWSFLIKPTPGTYYYCSVHKARIEDNPLLEYISSKFKPALTEVKA